MGGSLFLLTLVGVFSDQGSASIGSVFPSTGFTAPIPGFPSATFPLLQYDSLEKVARKDLIGKDNDQEASEAKAASITYSNLRNFSFEKSSNDSIDGDLMEEAGSEGELAAGFETTTVEVEASTNMIARDEKSLIGTFPFTTGKRKEAAHRVGDAAGHQHHQHHGGQTLGNRRRRPEHRNKGEIYGEHVALSNKIEVGQVKKFEVIHQLAQEGGKEEVKDGRRCVNKVDFNSICNFCGQHRQKEHMSTDGVIFQVMMVEETEYDEVLTCDHSYDNR